MRLFQATAVYFALVFAGGAVVGGFAHRLYTMSSVNAESGPQDDANYQHLCPNHVELRCIGFPKAGRCYLSSAGGSIGPQRRSRAAFDDA